MLFVGINPSLYSAAVGHHFARPGNRFWPTLHAAGFTPRLLSAFDDRELLRWRLGVTNVVAAATARADELTKAQLRGGGSRLVAKARRYEPQVVAVLGVTAYRTAFGRPDAVVGEQPDRIGPSRAWVLPNPSGLNAHYQLPALAEVFADLLAAVQ